MAEVKIQQIKGVYGTIKGMLSQIPLEKDSRMYVIPSPVSVQYNAALDRLTSISETDYSSHKLTEYDGVNGHISNSAGQHGIIAARIKMGSLIARLEEEYGFGHKDTTQTPPIIVSVSQNQQQVSVTVTPIQQIIDSAEDSELRSELEDLRQSIDENKSPEQTANMLNKIMNRSWEVFIKLLPWILEHWDKHPR